MGEARLWDLMELDSNSKSYIAWGGVFWFVFWVFLVLPPQPPLNLTQFYVVTFVRGWKSWVFKFLSCRVSSEVWVFIEALYPFPPFLVWMLLASSAGPVPDNWISSQQAVWTTRESIRHVDFLNTASQPNDTYFCASAERGQMLVLTWLKLHGNINYGNPLAIHPTWASFQWAGLKGHFLLTYDLIKCSITFRFYHLQGIQNLLLMIPTIQRPMTPLS